MIHKQHSPTSGHVRVRFQLPSCIWADRIFLVGDFNNWDQKATPLRQERSGNWMVTLDLPEGQRFEFCYLIDGNWQTDYNADGFAANKQGIQYSLVDTSCEVVLAGFDVHNSALPDLRKTKPILPLTPVSQPAVPALA